jgi:hypothetical protein
MDSKIFWQLNEAYQLGVCNQKVVEEETLSEEELVNINQWVSSLISEGYDLDDYSDEELYEAYLSALDEAKMDKGKTDVEKRATRRGRLVSGGNLSPGMQSKYNSPKYTPEDSVDEIEVGRQWAHRRSRGMKKPEAKSRPTFSGKYAAMQRRKGMNEELDLYDIVSEYLVSEGFCDSYEDADVIMVNMSEEWRESIVNTLIEEGFVSPYKLPHAHGRSMDNPGRLSPAMKAMKKSDKLQTTEPGSDRQKMQTRRSNQLNRLFSAARTV